MSARTPQRGASTTAAVLAETARRNCRRCVFDSRRDTRSRGGCGAPAGIPADNSDNDKQNVRGKLLSRTADCDSALRQRFLNLGRLRAIPGRAEQFVVDQPEIVRVSAPARV